MGEVALMDWAGHARKARYEAQGPLNVVSLAYHGKTTPGFLISNPTTIRALGVQHGPT